MRRALMQPVEGCTHTRPLRQTPRFLGATDPLLAAVLMKPTTGFYPKPWLINSIADA